MLLIIIIVAVVLLALGGLYTYVQRDNPRQGKIDGEREQVAEQEMLRGPTDFQSEFRAPRDP